MEELHFTFYWKAGNNNLFTCYTITTAYATYGKKQQPSE